MMRDAAHAANLASRSATRRPSHLAHKAREWANAISTFGGRPQHWLFYYDYLFRGISFEGKRVLDIGGGVGRSSYFAAALGAEHVVCIEPEAAGSESDMLASSRKLGERLGLTDIVTVVTTPVQDADIRSNFDIVMCLNAINHLDEELVQRIDFDMKARNRYASIIRRISDMTKPGGHLIVTDCTRYNFFGDLGLWNPFAPSITWKLHQPPELWAQLFNHANFVDPVIRWTPDRRSGRFGETFLANRFASYLLQSHFCLTMRKRQPMVPFERSAS